MPKWSCKSKTVFGEQVLIPENLQRNTRRFSDSYSQSKHCPKAGHRIEVVKNIRLNSAETYPYGLLQNPNWYIIVRAGDCKGGGKREGIKRVFRKWREVGEGKIYALLRTILQTKKSK